MMDKIDVIPIELNGKKYMTWSFHLKNFVEGEGMLGYLAGTQLKPTVDNDSTSTVPNLVDEKAVAT